MEYYNIFEENERGSYTPGFFQMKLSFPFNTNALSSLSLQNLGTFAHEYIHYLQNTSTPFGLWQAIVYYQSIGDFFSYIQKNHLNSKPIDGYVPTAFITRLMKLENEASGYRGFLEVDNNEPLIYSRSNEEVGGKSVERISISFKDIHGRSQKIILGANIIKESMAAMVQEIIDPASKDTHVSIPYHVVSRLAARYAPNIADDNKKLITLCFISLHTLAPGIKLMHLTFEKGPRYSN